MQICSKPQIEAKKERPGKQSVRISRSTVQKLLESNKNNGKDGNGQNLHEIGTPDPCMNVIEKCPSTISSYVGGFLMPHKTGQSSCSAARHHHKQQLDQMRENMKKLDDKQINQISNFAHHLKAIHEVSLIYDHDNQALASTVNSLAC
jgi:hypothetical protein